MYQTDRNNIGWVCPKCGRCLSPWVKECFCYPRPYVPPQPYTPYAWDCTDEVYAGDVTFPPYGEV